MTEPLEPWWTRDLLMHPMGAAHLVDPGDRWQPTPAPAPRVEAGERTYRVAWSVGELEADGIDVEVVGDLLVLRAVVDGQPISRAIPLPKDVDLARRRDHWHDNTLEVVVPVIRPTPIGRLRLWLARLLRRIAAYVAPPE